MQALLKKNKKILIILIIAFLTINLLSYIAIQIKTGTNVFNKDEYLKKKSTFYVEDPMGKIVHPFMGHLDLNNEIIRKNVLTNEPIFYQVYESPNKSYDEEIKILLLGGSIAVNLSNNTESAYDLKDKWRENKSKNILAKKILSIFPNKKVIFYNAAVKSSKQPMQLFKLYYLSLLGMDFDIVINFDGPQEMAQPYVKNVPIKDELIYPRRFSDDIAYMTRDFSCISKNNKESLKNSFIPVVEFFSYLVIRNCHRDISLFDGYPAFWKSIISTNSKNEEEIAKKSYEIWKNSSLEIENFSKLKNFFYLHVIMPSQYVEDSKKFSSKESDEFIGYEYGPIISKYYSKMINFNNLNLKNSLDLKYIFKNETKTVYRDRCCRFNDYGLNAIASEISKYIGQNY